MNERVVRNRPASPPTCIYCRSTTNPFNREHAINQAFGTFKVDTENDFFLRHIVCQSCNQVFGDTIDLALGRDSAEAILRYKFGLKSPARADDLSYNRVTLKFWVPGEFYGAYFELGSDAAGLNLVPTFPTQIGLRWKGAARTKWLLESEVSAEAVAEYRKAPAGGVEMLILGPREEDRKRVENAVRNGGITVANKRDVTGQTRMNDEIVTQVSTLLDDSILRGLAKIAFNYVACVHGADFILRSDFDQLRNYIRHGAASRMPFVVQADGGILTDEPRGQKFTDGHLITFEWNRTERGLLARVSLFNHAKYHVLFCTNYSGIWSNELVSGHHFDIETGEISSLSSVSMIHIPGVTPGRVAIRR
ncbi:MAG: HNH endonuclease [Candidatus Acidiferrales bacterium]